MKNELEIRHNNEPKGSDHGELNNEPVSWVNKIRAAIALITIEPYLFCCILSGSIFELPLNRFYEEKACRAGLNYTKEQCYSTLDKNVLNQIYSMVADLKTWRVPVHSAIPMFAILFAAAWSDRTGNRKALMMVPMIGELLSALGLVLATYFFDELSLLATGLIEVLPVALSGGYYVSMMGSFCYLADVTSVETRTFRMGIGTIVMVVSLIIGKYIGPKLLNAADYYGIFGVSAALHGLGVFYTYFMVHDVKTIKIVATWQTKLMSFVDPSSAWSTISIAFKSGPDRAKILLIMAAYVVIAGPFIGNENIFKYHLRTIYEMDDADITMFLNYNMLLFMGGIMMSVTLFSKYLRMHDAILGIIATVSLVMGHCMYGLAPTASWLYFGPVLALFGGSWLVVIRSLRTKVVGRKRIAKVYSLSSVMEALVPLIFRPMYLNIYINTVDKLPGALWLIEAAMVAPAAFIFIMIYKQFKKEERDRVTDPQIKEWYAHDNHVTSL